MKPVKLTENASQAPDLEALCLSILRHYAETMSLRELLDAIGIDKSPAWLSHRIKGSRTSLDLEIQTAILAWADDAPAIPRPVVDVVADHTDPDAQVWKIGDALANRVIMLHHDPDDLPLWVHVNGTVRVSVPPYVPNGDSDTNDDDEADVTPVTSSHSANQRPKRHRLTVTPDDYAWMRDNGYPTVSDMIAALKGEA